MPLAEPAELRLNNTVVETSSITVTVTAQICSAPTTVLDGSTSQADKLLTIEASLTFLANHFLHSFIIGLGSID